MFKGVEVFLLRKMWTLHARSSLVLESHRYFFGDGREVWNRFLKKWFHYNSGIIGKDRATPSLQDELPVVVQTLIPPQQLYSGKLYNRSSNMDSSSNSEMIIERGTSLQKEKVISFIRTLSEDWIDMMPDSEELHLPLFNKHHVYSVLLDKFRKLCPTREPPFSKKLLRSRK